MRRLLLLVTLLFMLPIKVSASKYGYCDLQDLNKMQKLANNITTSYYYDEVFDPYNHGNLKFSIRLSNTINYLYIKDNDTGFIYDNLGTELIINDIEPGIKKSFQVYANEFGCGDTYLTTIYVNLPSYNPYYKDSVCDDYQGYKLCSKWIDVNMSYSDFISNVEKYKYDFIKDDDKPGNKDFYDIFEMVIDFLDKYKFYIFIPLILISGIGIIIAKVKENKNRFDLR